MGRFLPAWLTGYRRARVARLIRADINLFAFHLPLDVHPELGNNAQLALRLGLVESGRAGDQGLLCFGHPDSPLTLGEFTGRVDGALGRTPLAIGDPDRVISQIAWCTGGAQGYFNEAIRLGVDAFLTGEISEQHVHLAHETGVAFIAAGHHATERYGVQAVGGRLAAQFGLEHRFIDIPNPV
jgi:dinuclear metal center YbgI/SA1388 family protein